MMLMVLCEEGGDYELGTRKAMAVKLELGSVCLAGRRVVLECLQRFIIGIHNDR
jgi:hypothetical protein